MLVSNKSDLTVNRNRFRGLFLRVSFVMKQLLFALQILTLVPSAFAEFAGELTEIELDVPTEIEGIPSKTKH